MKPPTIMSLAAAVLLVACGGSDPVVNDETRRLASELPEKPGVYAVTDAGLQPISGSRDWERATWSSRSDFEPNVEFVVHSPGLATDPRPPETVVTLHKVAWLRSELAPKGKTTKIGEGPWVAPNVPEFTVPLVAATEPRAPGVIRFRPITPLDPGLYELVSLAPGTTMRARIGVGWNGVDKVAYSRENCVDRLYAGISQYRRCGDPAMRTLAREVEEPGVRTSQTPLPNPLRLSLETPKRESGGLTIRGAVTNSSGITVTAPALRGTILDRNGNPADSWLFALPVNEVKAGETVEFVTWRPAGEGVARLNVDFAESRLYARGS